MPSGDSDFSTRWNLLKGHFSRAIDKGERVSKSRTSLQPCIYSTTALQHYSTEMVKAVSEVKVNDFGLYEITQNLQHRWQYRTPRLRNITLTAPYMHNGIFSTLQQVVKFYNQGGIAHENLSPLINPLNLNSVEIQALVAFLNALTGDNVI